MPDPNITYCAACRCKRHYHVISEEVTLTANGITFESFEDSAICEVCGNTLYVPELNDKNATLREEAYQRAVAEQQEKP